MPKGHSRVDDIIDFFSRNPEEVLTTSDVQVKFKYWSTSSAALAMQRVETKTAQTAMPIAPVYVDVYPYPRPVRGWSVRRVAS